MARKTFNVQEFKEYCNVQLSRTDEVATQEFKSSITVVIEKVLTGAGSYNGYSYINAEFNDVNGINFYNRKYI